MAEAWTKVKNFGCLIWLKYDVFRPGHSVVTYTQIAEMSTGRKKKKALISTSSINAWNSSN